MRIIAHIPARAGSKRLTLKNLRPLNGEPLISYAIRAVLGSSSLDEVYVNTESEEIAKVGAAYGAKIFMRDEHLAQDMVTQDTFNYDFVTKTNPDILVLLNPVCPLIEAQDIDSAVETFLKHRPDCLVTTTDFQSCALLDERPINFDANKILPRTQDIPSVRLINFAINIWDAQAFIRQFETHSHACLYGKVLYSPLAKNKSIKISDIEDFSIAEALIKAKAVSI